MREFANIYYDANNSPNTGKYFEILDVTLTHDKARSLGTKSEVEVKRAAKWMNTVLKECCKCLSWFIVSLRCPFTLFIADYVFCHSVSLPTDSGGMRMSLLLRLPNICFSRNRSFAVYHPHAGKGLLSMDSFSCLAPMSQDMSWHIWKELSMFDIARPELYK